MEQQQLGAEKHDGNVKHDRVKQEAQSGEFRIHDEHDQSNGSDHPE